MTFENLSEEAQATAKGMIEYCIENGLCMGMDEGLIFNDDLDVTGSQPFRKELEAFSKN